MQLDPFTAPTTLWNEYQASANKPSSDAKFKYASEISPQRAAIRNKTNERNSWLI